ncbi:unnamed protein product [Umbelopsis ramanniana]
MLRNIVRKYTTAVTANPTVKPLARTAEQASNRAATWARSQQPKADAFVGPKFEQRNLSKQPNPMAAIELISEEPIHFVTERIAVCNGGGGALGNPKFTSTSTRLDPTLAVTAVFDLNERAATTIK